MASTKRKRAANTKSVTRIKKWSAKVTEKSDAMDLEAGVFKSKSAVAIARSLKRSAEASRRRKSTPFQSAMSMLTFEINRAASNLSQDRLRVLNRAKSELRKLFLRVPSSQRAVKH
jgi:hypothetical protein